MLNVLLTNDDGIEAEGLHEMREALVALADVRLVVIAPDGNRSAMARSITTNRPLWVEAVPFPDGTTGYTTDGTPVDCVRLASLKLIEDFETHVVVSGINHGNNLGDDITYSGTVAAAIEGLVLGLPSIAVSQQLRGRQRESSGEGLLRFEHAASFVARLVERLSDLPLPAGTLLNVNVPLGVPQGVEVSRLGTRIYRDELKLEREEPGPPARRRYWIYGHDPGFRDEPGTDLAAVAAGRVAVTPLHFDLTYRPGVERLREFDLESLLEPVPAVTDELSGVMSKTPASVAERVGELTDALDRANWRYYVLDDPELADDAYDALLDELRALEAEHPELRGPDSPTQRVGAEPVSHLEKVRHPEPMLSLGNVRSAEELRQWVSRMRGHLAREGIEEPSFEYVVEPKVDGLAISLIYRDGVLERGATRGNGEIGEDVTHNLRTIKAIPLHVEDAPPLLEVRGEIYMSLHDFAELNERRAEAGESTFMNPRNSAAGTVRQLDPALAAERPLSFWCYQVGVADGLNLATHWEALAWLREHRFPVNRDVVLLESEEDVIGRCLEWEQRRGALDFEIDGAVVKVSDLELQRRLGSVGRDPRWAVAWKFAPTTAVTRLRSIGWNVGRSGDLHPYAVLEPVAVGGVTIKLATLHNEEDMLRKDIREGEDVIVLRAGEVIPQVISPAPHVAERASRPAPPRPPERCPFCDTKTVKPEGAVFTRCPNRECPERRWQLLKHFASRGAMDIAGLGEKQVAVLQQHGLVGTPADFYRLTEEKLLPLERFAEISVRNLLAAIESSKQRPFARVLVALGIEEVGEITAQNLAQQFGDIDALLEASAQEIAQTPGIGEKTAAMIREQLDDEQMRSLIAQLRELGLRFAQEGPVASGGPLAGKTVVLTGTLPNLSREQASERIRAAGGRVTSSVSQNTDFVVAGDSPGSKLQKAERMEVAVIDEAGLLDLIA